MSGGQAGQRSCRRNLCRWNVALLGKCDKWEYSVRDVTVRDEANAIPLGAGTSYQPNLNPYSFETSTCSTPSRRSAAEDVDGNAIWRKWKGKIHRWWDWTILHCHLAEISFKSCRANKSNWQVSDVSDSHRSIDSTLASQLWHKDPDEEKYAGH